MTDANAGSATAEKPDAGTPGATSGAADQGSKGGADDAFSGLETGTREWIGTKGYKSVADLAKAAQNAESLIGRSVQIPGDDAKPEDIDKFLDKATAKFRPKEPDGYEFKLPDDAPKDMPYDGEFADGFKGVAHKLGLTAKQAQGLHDYYVGHAGKAFTANNDTVLKRASDASEALEKAWGAPDSDSFKDASEMVIRAMKGLGIEDTLQEAGLFGPKRMVLNAKLALGLEKVGRAMFKEDSLETGSGPGAGASNPFAEGPGKGNLTEQNLIWNRNRTEAERLIRAAGHTPEAFGFKSG